MPEGDTVRHAANQIRAVLDGVVPDRIETPQRRHAKDRWPEKLAGSAVKAVDTHGKHLFIRFDNGYAIHSHLGMVGSWRVYDTGEHWKKSASRAWLVIEAQGCEAVQFDGPTLDLLTDLRTRSDQRLAGLGPDVLADAGFDQATFLRRLRADDPARGIGDALLDQRTLAGIGNIWRAEGCWEAGLDPWRPLGQISDEQALAIVDAIRPRMQRSAELGPKSIEPRVYGRAGRSCPRCGGRIQARGQGEANRRTYWCPGCQA